MIIVVIIISIIYIILLALILKAYYKNITDLENRMLQLEKRINEIENSKLFKEVNEEDIEYLKKWDNEYKNWVFNPFDHGLNITGESFSKPKKKENNTQEGSESDMPCGRKKGRGGRKK